MGVRYPIKVVSYNYNRLEWAGNKLGSIIVADPRICRCEKYLRSEDNGFLDEAFGDEREIVREPGVDPAFERANPGDSFGSQQQRHTGAGRFVGSRTVENDVAIPGESP